MSWWRLIWRSVTFHARSHLGTFLGAAVGTAVLAGALIVGDSVRGTLRKMALDRLGKVTEAIASGDRLFRSALAGDLSKASGAHTASGLQLIGTAVNPNSSLRANKVQVLGVGGDFWNLSSAPLATELADNTVWLNRRLAEKLQTKEGDAILLRVPKSSQLSRDAPLSPVEDSAAALRVSVGRILSDEEFGRFSLHASQVAPYNAFVPLHLLQTRIGATNQANLLLASAGATPLSKVLPKVMTLADAQLELRQLTNQSTLELRSSRVFLDDIASQAALGCATNRIPIFTYFVNELRAGPHSTPYSMVTAAASPLVPDDLKDGEIIINQWLADDLQAKANDQLTLTYFVVGLGRELVEQTNSFRIHAIIPMNSPLADRTLMPDFPGMTTAENCRDWDTGFPIKTQRIRDKDEAYWHQYRGTPKAFITLAAGQKMWSNRFGNLTAVRYPISRLGLAEGQSLASRSAPSLPQNGGEGRGEEALPAKAFRAQLESKLLSFLPPEKIGLQFQPVREQALAASSQAQDFGGLFIGFSFFLVVAALILMSLLFRFSLEQRGVEIGTLLALGFTPNKVRRNLLVEGAVIAVLASLIGLLGGIGYAHAMLYALTTIWKEAIAGSAIWYFASAQTLIISAVSGTLIALGTIWWSLRKEARRPARELLAEGMQERAFAGDLNSGTRRGIWKVFRAEWVVFICGVGGIALAGWGLLKPEKADADLFFSAGTMALIAGLAAASWGIRKLARTEAAARLSIRAMGLRSVTRRSTRSRATIGLLGCGSFLIASIGAFHLDSERESRQRASGTGGFALIGESALAVLHNLNTAAGRDAAGLAGKALQDVQVVSCRVREGEEASCLNLNRAQRPRLMGVNPGELASRQAFSFTKILNHNSTPNPNPWLVLNQDFGPHVIPAVGDAASIQWALGRKVGDDLLYLDEHGQQMRIKIVGAVANSILQGSLLISEQNFVKLFPSEAGYRFFLIDCPPEKQKEVGSSLSQTFQDAGLELTPASERLAAFNAVQNTYLNTFQLLGGLGLLLGTAGLGVVLLRNVFERRGEFALLLAVGFRRGALQRLVLSEHAALLVVGMLIGMMAAAIAVLPALFSRGPGLPYISLTLSLSAVLVVGLLATFIASWIALRGRILDGLRAE